MNKIKNFNISRKIIFLTKKGLIFFYVEKNKFLIAFVKNCNEN